jgi:carbon-monoxide dehydrogenase iron sulfur subunit
MMVKGSNLAVYVDIDRCIECFSCEVACKQEHNLPAGLRLLRVLRLERLNKGRVERISGPSACMHCFDAPCVSSCPSKALGRNEDGIVLVKRSRCIGCKMCLIACPFGAPQFDNEGVMIKCDLCVNRLRQGEKPACVSACTVEALKFGTVEDLSYAAKEKWLNQIWKLKEPRQKASGSC